MSDLFGKPEDLFSGVAAHNVLRFNFRCSVSVVEEL